MSSYLIWLLFPYFSVWLSWKKYWLWLGLLKWFFCVKRVGMWRCFYSKVTNWGDDFKYEIPWIHIEMTSRIIQLGTEAFFLSQMPQKSAKMFWKHSKVQAEALHRLNSLENSQPYAQFINVNKTKKKFRWNYKDG